MLHCRTFRLTLAVILVTAAASRGQLPSEHWAWPRPARPAVPDNRNPIDHFIRAKLEKVGLTLAPAASREQLIRRATFDLTGLPPTPEEIAAFVEDTSANAWEKVIDRLLASARYGER